MDAVESALELNNVDACGEAVLVAVAAAGTTLEAAGRDARTVWPKRAGEVAACGDGEIASAIGRNFLFERSTDPDGCQERLCDRAMPDVVGSGLDGEAYF